MKRDIYVFNDGEIRRKDNTILFETETGKKYIPVEEINNIWIFGEVTLNKTFLDFVSQKEICLHFFNYYGYYSGSFYPREHLNSGYVILKQVEHYLDYAKRMEIAREIIITGIKNIIVILKYYNGRGLDLSQRIDNITNMMEDMKEVNKIEQLMALEGNIRDEYYSCFNDILKNEDFKFTQRSKRPPLDNINSLISFGNSIMYTTVLGEIYQTQLDPRIGYLHSTNERRFTLNLDIAEIFKPIVVDRTIFSLINRGVIIAKDFEKDFNGILMSEKGKKKFIEEYNGKLDAVIKHPRLNTSVSYKRLIRLELYKIQKHITEGEKYKGFVAGW
ncbi:type I-B CRISPR-associated endonuclease Cas1b [Lutispora thermophila]|uniref:CRISPR-associated endonuclease Cas1 n=1 Tax=Lutispora thermophila DSM 19022 TaxID=1122184 RepID=A0A1M6E9N9_9FIRM|nr:type I-B CRISPR-associated endonuclease Cas1b [Lutispora thermophila]SHI82165.1 CRISPR-associated protein, Cas1 family [Lutispora thermophila DSM 19022]